MTKWTVPASVVRVVDGDTFVLDLDLGWHITYRARCRINSVNAPELSTPEGVAAKSWAQTQVKPGDDVTFSSHELDKYGRPLGELFYGMKVYSAELLEAGHAVRFG